MKWGWKLLPIAVFLVLSLFLWRGLSLDPRHLPSAQLDKSLPDFKLGQLVNPNQDFTPELMRNQVVLLNVWASWCAACVEEQAFLMELAAKGYTIYGLNYKDDRDQALEWLRQWGNPYKAIGSDLKGKAAIDLGVYGTPETFIIDKKGVIRYRHVGILHAEFWSKSIEPLIRSLEQQA